MSPAARRAWSWFKRVAPWILATGVLTLVARLALTVDWPAVWQSLQTMAPARLVAAAALALVSYALYASFDLVGRRLTGHALSIPRTIAIAAISYTFGLNFGSWIGGIGLRLRLYMRRGLAASTVARIVAHSVVTNWLGYKVFDHSFFAWWMSEWQTPQNSTWICTSHPRGSSRSKAKARRGPCASWAAYPRAEIMGASFKKCVKRTLWRRGRGTGTVSQTVWAANGGNAHEQAWGSVMADASFRTAAFASLFGGARALANASAFGLASVVAGHSSGLSVSHRTSRRASSARYAIARTPATARVKLRPERSA